jgi:uncharacterized protein
MARLISHTTNTTAFIALTTQAQNAYLARDYKRAIKLYTKPAQAGHAHSQNMLGLIYYHYRSTTQDTTQALKWFGRAADQGFALAQYNIAVIYHYGTRVSQDLATAISWYNKAAEHGHSHAIEALLQLGGIQY